MKRRSWAALVLAVLTSSLFAPRPASAESPSLEQVLTKFDEVQASVHTLSAWFTETTVNELLKEPMVARGRFYMTKPDSVMWEYTSPEAMQFVISKDEYVGYFPARKQAERRNIQRWREQIFRFFGLGQVSAELEKFYDIRLEPSDPSMKGTYKLALDPKKRRVKKRMESVLFWVDATTYLPVKVEYRDRSGNTRVIRFSGMQVNPDLSASLYRLDIPSDVTVTTGFGGFQALGATQ
jgi:outer membrane lipoprotein-sorting protein